MPSSSLSSQLLLLSFLSCCEQDDRNILDHTCSSRIALGHVKAAARATNTCVGGRLGLHGPKPRGLQRAISVDTDLVGCLRDGVVGRVRERWVEFGRLRHKWFQKQRQRRCTRQQHFKKSKNISEAGDPTSMVVWGAFVPAVPAGW